MKPEVAAPIALTAMFSAGQVSAEAKSQRVYYSDLDLTKDRDASELKTHVARALKRVCTDHRVRDLAADKDTKNCRAAALADAMLRVDHSVAGARSDHQPAVQMIELPLR